MKTQSAFLALATLCLCKGSYLPGLKIRMSSTGLDYVARAALDVTVSRLSGKSIDDQHGQSGKTKYDITGMRITAFSKPSTETTVAPGSGITWKLSGGSLSIHGDWHFKYRQNRFIKLSDSGSFDASVSGLDIKVSIILGMDNNGQPTIHTTGCSAQVGSAHVHLHGGGSWFYNIFTSVIDHKVKNKLKDMLCDAAHKSIDEEGATRMRNLNLQVIFAKLLLLDYRMVAAPNFTNSFVESFHKGEVFEKGDLTEAPFHPLPLPHDIHDGPRMMTFWASDYVLNTLGYLLQRYGLVQYWLTNADVSQYFPNSSVAVHMVSDAQDDVPRFTMLPGELRCHLAGMAYFSARTSNGSHAHMFKARVNMTTSMSLYLCDGRVKVKVDTFSIKMKMIHTFFKSVTESEVETFFKVIADIWIIPKLNELGDVGIKLPSFKDIAFVNQEINIMKGAMQLGVDFKAV